MSQMLDPAAYASLGLGTVYDKVMQGQRLSIEDGELLFACPDILAVGALAHLARLRRHGLQTFYVRNRHINYSNVCVNNCRFCAFRRGENETGAFTLSKEEIIARAIDDGGHPFAEIHVVGGCHPHLRLAWFEDVFRTLAKRCPKAVLKAFTVAEIDHFSRMEHIPVEEVLSRLKDSGLAMLTGGGAEIFNPSVRERICPEKITGEQYLAIAGKAHELGLFSNCSMLFGHIESTQDRVRHLVALREQQDKSKGFVCFIPLAFQPQNNALASSLAAGQKHPLSDADTGLDRLKTIAVARLLLDNIPHIKAYWVMLGTKTAQASLSFGADDLDGTIMEEHIGHMAGASSAQAMTRTELEHMISRCGFVPVNRDALFTPLGASDSQTQTGSNDDNQTGGHTKVQAPEKAEKNSCAALSRDALRPAPEDVTAIVQRLRNAYTDRIAHTKKQYGFAGPVKEARLSREEAAALYFGCDLYTLGSLAHLARMALHPTRHVTYVADRNINYSNICVCACRFCAFFRPPGHAQGYVISKESLDKKIRETIALGGTQILMQGGHHPDLPLAFYEDLIAWIRDTHPGIHIHSFSPPEIFFFAHKEGLTVRQVIERLVAAGLHSIPGGGAEILVDRVRTAVSPNKCSAADWLKVMETAHELGLKTTATMMFGHEETDAERLEHFFAVRDQQDTSEGFTAFIPWTFQPAHTNIDCLPETAQAYLRVLALSRLVLDNVPSIQASWVTMGPHIAQLALRFGANDFGSLMIEENVVAAAGVSFQLSREEIHSIINRAGFIPAQRTMNYSLITQGAENA